MELLNKKNFNFFTHTYKLIDYLKQPDLEFKLIINDIYKDIKSINTYDNYDNVTLCFSYDHYFESQL